MDTISAVDPMSKPATVWRSELGVHIRQGLSEEDSRVREARAGLAYWKVRSAIDAAKSSLSPAGADALCAQLLGLAR